MIIFIVLSFQNSIYGKKLIKTISFMALKGCVSKETVVLRRWEVLQANLVLSTGLIM